MDYLDQWKLAGGDFFKTGNCHTPDAAIDKNEQHLIHENENIGKKLEWRGCASNFARVFLIDRPAFLSTLTGAQSGRFFRRSLARSFAQ